ncbi:hypothetical protein RUM44_004065 [Polyplax serrata]|uniref:Uncharacterized protein n=1 Tax=Polyplax serrata TaxID=468196 RepID=A0ABR1B1R1_POLSC
MSTDEDSVREDEEAQKQWRRAFSEKKRVGRWCNLPPFLGLIKAYGLQESGDDGCSGFILFERFHPHVSLIPAIVKGGTNLVGKFTQSVRRIVQDVKDEGTASGLTKEEVIETNERLRTVRARLEENYDTAKKALNTLMAKYMESKTTRNVFHRYPQLKVMIKEVIRLETQYWALVEIPKQEKQETVPSFVLRACSIMEKTQKSGEGVKTSAKIAEEEERRRERLNRLEDMTIAQIEAENTQLTNDLYRLLKKYSGLRNLIRELKSQYVSSKIYPMFPRYTFLKDMIKDIMHDPDYMEVCHEVDAV